MYNLKLQLKWLSWTARQQTENSDEFPILETVSAVVARKGYKVLTAKNEKEGLKILNDKTTTLDLLITDVVMPMAH